jgi:hypothetical protein
MPYRLGAPDAIQKCKAIFQFLQENKTTCERKFKVP